MSKTWKERLDKVPREERHHEFKRRKKEIQEQLDKTERDCSDEEALLKDQNDSDLRL